jgi:hypothetical protein
LDDNENDSQLQGLRWGKFRTPFGVPLQHLALQVVTLIRLREVAAAASAATFLAPPMLLITSRVFDHEKQNPTHHPGLDAAGRTLRTERMLRATVL